MTRAIRIHAVGGPEVLKWEDVEIGAPGPGEVRLRQTAIGLNFIDVYYRTGLYPLPLPAVIGQEAAGVVEAVGPGVSGLAVGDRVAYAAQNGAYARERLVPAERLVTLPEAISDESAAAMMLKGLTAHYLVRRTHRISAGETILVHAAAGGVGTILCQWAKALGAIVIGTVSTEEKAARARENGCDHVILYTRESVPERVRALTGGEGARVVYDAVGRDTFEASIDSLRRFGLMVSYGNASGPPPPVNLLSIGLKGSLFLSRPILSHYIAKRADLESAAAELFDVVARGDVKVAIGARYPLAEAAQAHRDLEGRRTTGSTVLFP